MPAPIAKPEATHATAFAAPTPDEALAETLAAAAPIETTAPSACSLPPSARSGVARQAAGDDCRRQGSRRAGGKGRTGASRASRRIRQGRGTLRLGPAPYAPAAAGPSRSAPTRTRAKPSSISARPRARSRGVLQKAEAYIERTVKGAKTYYRARFAGFDRDQAEAACKRLKREDVACMALKI